MTTTEHVSTTEPAGDTDAANPTALSGERLVINPSVSIIRSTDDEIIAHIGTRSRSSHRISDSQGRGRLADFITGFATPNTPADLAREHDLDDETTHEFVDHLTRGNVLVPEQSTRFSYLVSGLGLAPTEQDVHITVAGEGAIAAAVSRQLTELLGQEVGVTTDIQDAFEGTDLVVVASDRVAPALCYDADELANATGTPWQLVYLDGFELMVGPTFVPGESANYYDFDAMDESARVLRTQYLYDKSSSAAVPATAEVPGFVADMAASWASMAIAQHLWGPGSFLEGYVMRVDLERMQVMRDKVLRLPRNPVDVGARADLRHPFL